MASLAFRLNTDDLIIAGPSHPIVARGDPDVPALYLGVRGGAEARLNRSTYGQLIEIALAEGKLSVESQGAAVYAGAAMSALFDPPDRALYAAGHNGEPHRASYSTTTPASRGRSQQNSAPPPCSPRLPSATASPACC